MAATVTSHVDDQLSAGSVEGLDHVEAALGSQYELKTDKEPSLYLGAQLERVRPRRWLKVQRLLFLNTIWYLCINHLCLMMGQGGSVC